jgi:iron transport multicopper oxidase
MIKLKKRYHDQMPGLINYYLGLNNSDGAEPVPKSGLINDAKTTTFEVKPGKTYLIRIINVSALAAQFIHFDGHEMTIVAVDGVPVQPQKTDFIYASAAQRYEVLINAIENPTRNYAFLVSMDSSMFDDVPADLQLNNTGVLCFGENFGQPKPVIVDAFTPFDDFELTPLDGQKALDNVDQTITLNLAFNNINGVGQR